MSGSPILILSCYRTGSTLLRFIIDTHPEIYSPPEVSLGEAAFYLARFATSLKGLSDDEGPMAPEVLSWIRAILGGEMRTAAAAKGKPVWCEKTPTNLIPRNLKVLGQVFPDARYICLHRHALDMAQSLMKMIGRLEDLQPFLMVGGVVTAAINYWNERTTTLLQHEQDNPSRCFRLRYEDMVADPAKALEPMFRFLDVGWDESLVTSVFEVQHDRGMDDHYIAFTNSIHTRSLGAGRGLSLKGVPEKTLAAMRALLQRLGYADVPASASATSADAKAISAQDLRWFFETHLPAQIRAEPDLYASLAGSFLFVVTGEGGGAWAVDPRHGRVAAGRAAASCGVEISAADLWAIARGELHPWKAAEQGRLRLSGDFKVRDLEKLMRMFQLPKVGGGVPS